MPDLSALIDDELTIASLHDALRKKTTTCTEVIAEYVARISKYNPTLKAIITVNPDALKYAKEKDVETAALMENGRAFPPLHGVPVILKDTYTTHDMPTTSGVKALSTLQSTTDAPVVSSLRKAGAIILAKANLHEFSLEGATISSLGGQTLNPYDLTRTPGGSSGGTAAALAADLGLVGCGGDTVNSLRSPASACSVVGFRPTKGVIEKEGIFPVSLMQDVAGPMGRCVDDVRTLFNVMRGSEIPKPAETKTLQIGILTSYFDHSSPTTNTVLSAINLLKLNTPITLINLPEYPSWDVLTLRSKLDVQSFEFRSTLDAFLESPNLSAPYKSLSSIAASGQYHTPALTPVFYETLSEEFTQVSPEYHTRLSAISALKSSVKDCFEEYNLDAIIYPHQRQLVIEVGSMTQPGRNGILAALTGCPAVCIPAGFAPSESAPIGVPVGLELMGREGDDDRLLGIAGMFESVLRARRRPEL